MARRRAGPITTTYPSSCASLPEGTCIGAIGHGGAPVLARLLRARGVSRSRRELQERDKTPSRQSDDRWPSAWQELAGWAREGAPSVALSVPVSHYGRSPLCSLRRRAKWLQGEPRLSRAEREALGQPTPARWPPVALTW